MKQNESFCEELQFLSELTSDRIEEYRSAPWLKSLFEDNEWLCIFSAKIKLQISFNIHLYNGEALTSEKHSQLLVTLKCWICVQTHPDATQDFLGPDLAQRKVLNSLQVIDYLLLNGEQFQLAEHGLLALTKNSILAYFHGLSQSRSIYTAIYQWSSRLTSYLKTKIHEANIESLRSTIKETPFLSLLDPDSSRQLNLSECELILARAWLWQNGYYQATSLRHGFRYYIVSARLANEIYKNTLMGKSRKPVIEDLMVGPYEIYNREYHAVPVKENNLDKGSESKFAQQIVAFRNLGLLSEIDLPIPPALATIQWKHLAKQFDLKSNGRVRTVPPEIILGAVRNAIEFSLKFGDDIVQSFLNIATLAHSGEASCYAFFSNSTISEHVTPKLAALGVRYWSIAAISCANSTDPHRKTEYFKMLRSSYGLWELVRILYGGTAIVVGALMARRNKELQELMAGSAIDGDEKYLLFSNRKSGAIGLRETLARPIPPIAIEMIRRLEHIQTGLIGAGIISQQTNLFSYPPLAFANQLSCMYSETISTSIDYFCDYFEMPINERGQRYYIRVHQLRRFFAMLFFWSPSFGQADILRWFLGHTDIEHLYNYITESTEGDVLRSLKAKYCLSQVQQGNSELSAISDLLESKFSTRDFYLLDDQELSEYLEELMDRSIIVEPVFFDGIDGKEYRIAVIVRDQR